MARRTCVGYPITVTIKVRTQKRLDTINIESPLVDCQTYTQEYRCDQPESPTYRTFNDHLRRIYWIKPFYIKSKLLHIRLLINVKILYTLFSF